MSDLLYRARVVEWAALSKGLVELLIDVSRKKYVLMKCVANVLFRNDLGALFQMILRGSQHDGVSGAVSL